MPYEEQVLARLREKHPQALNDSGVVRPGVARVVIDRANIRPLCMTLRDELGFEHLSLVSAVDWVTRFECVYHVTSWENRAMVQINAHIPHDDPEIDSVEDIWHGANWHEREAFDMMGITFRGHPDLRRILMPRDFEFYPLRKDYRGE